MLDKVAHHFGLCSARDESSLGKRIVLWGFSPSSSDKWQYLTMFHVTRLEIPNPVDILHRPADGAAGSCHQRPWSKGV